MKLSHVFVIGAAVLMAGCTNATKDTAVLPATQTQNQTAKPAHQAFDLSTAISIAEAKTGGVATNLEIFYAQDGKPTAYEIETITTTHEHQVQIDAKTGEVLSIHQEYDLNVMPNVKISLKDVVRIAQANRQGQLQEIELERKAIGSYYEAKILADHPYELRIDAGNGQIIQNRVDYDD